jgi:hypothetical protein
MLEAQAAKCRPVPISGAGIAGPATAYRLDRYNALHDSAFASKVQAPEQDLSDYARWFHDDV